MAKYLGIDPGKTTGVCVVTLRGREPYPLYWAEIKLDEQGIKDLHTLCSLVKTHRPEIVALEDVVKTGKMNRDKFDQCRAFERAFIASHLSVKDTYLPVRIVRPESTKKCSNEVPKQVVGTHARDAFRIIVSQLEKEKLCLIPT